MTHSVAIRVDEIDFSRLTPAEYTFTPSADGLAPGTLSPTAPSASRAAT